MRLAVSLLHRAEVDLIAGKRHDSTGLVHKPTVFLAIATFMELHNCPPIVASGVSDCVLVLSVCFPGSILVVLLAVSLFHSGEADDMLEGKRHDFTGLCQRNVAFAFSATISLESHNFPETATTGASACVFVLREVAGLSFVVRLAVSLIQSREVEVTGLTILQLSSFLVQSEVALTATFPEFHNCPDTCLSGVLVWVFVLNV